MCRQNRVNSDKRLDQSTFQM